MSTILVSFISQLSFCSFSFHSASGILNYMDLTGVGIGLPRSEDNLQTSFLAFYHVGPKPLPSEHLLSKTTVFKYLVSLYLCVCEFMCTTYMQVPVEARGCQIPEAGVVSHLCCC